MEKKKRAKKRHYRQIKYEYRRQQYLKLLTLIGLVIALLLLVLAVIGLLAKPKAAKTGGETAETSAKVKTAAKAETAAGDTKSGAEVPPVTLTVSLAGDCTLGTDESFDVSTSLNAFYESYGSEYFFGQMQRIFGSDDLTIVNMEGTLTDSEEREDKLFAFKAPAGYADILRAGSVEAVTLANNHSHDYGEQSFADTKAALDAAGIAHFGYDETAVLEIKGVKVGLVGIYELYDHMERKQQLTDNIAKVKADGAQLVIAVFHWGNEKETVPDTNQIQLGHLAIDEGADLVVGHHPHVLQGVEKYKERYIAYSLGNFCFGGNAYPSDMDSMVFQQTFTVTADGAKKNGEIRLLPCRISSEYEYNDYQPTPAEGEEGSRILEKIRERSLEISDSMEPYFQK